MKSSLEIISPTPEATKEIAARLAGMLPPGTVVALRGDLGAGKTCFVQGLAAALPGDSRVHSPTFTLVNEYGPGPALYHIDLYRLDDLTEILDLGVEEIFTGQAICAIEWAERAEPVLPDRRIDVTLEHCPEGRKIRVTDLQVLPQGWEDQLTTRNA